MPYRLNAPKGGLYKLPRKSIKTGLSVAYCFDRRIELCLYKAVINASFRQRCLEDSSFNTQRVGYFVHEAKTTKKCKQLTYPRQSPKAISNVSYNR